MNLLARCRVGWFSGPVTVSSLRSISVVSSPALPGFALALLGALPVAAAEKPIPSQADLDRCFADGVSLEDRMKTTYSANELAALDKALAAQNLTRGDLDFRKDYAEGKLAFPLILDMMKHPLHIAPYMDGMAASIESLAGNEVFAVPEVPAAALLHPGIGAARLPKAADIAAEAVQTSTSAGPSWPGVTPAPPEWLRPVLAALAAADAHAARAVASLSEDEVKVLRLNLPKLMAWHEVFESPYPEDEKKRLDKLLEDQTSQAYLDELATKIDLTEMLRAYAALPDPRKLAAEAAAMPFPADQPLVFATPWGRVAVGTPKDDVYTGEFAAIIEPGGNDTYTDCRIGAAYGTPGNRAGYLLDMGGRDRYFCKGRNITLGAAVLGVAAFYDLGGQPDLYEGGHAALGSASGGIASFVDDGGADTYFSKSYGQGAAGYGIGVMADRAPKPPDTAVSPANQEEQEIAEDTIENNRYEAWVMSQALSRQWGVAICHGSRGNDVYHAGGVYLHAPLFNDRYQSFSQGFSIGSRDVDYAGGIALLIDDGGNDYYLGDIYNQGVGYWYAGGFLLDRGGNDHYEMTQYGQGSGIHLAVGGIIDLAGNDSYTMNSGLGQGGSHDFAASVMMDRGGIDRYEGSTSCNGSGLTNAVGLFFDREGNDIYGADPNAATLGGGRWARDTGSIGIFVDAGGNDSYMGDARDNRLWTHDQFGAGIDLEPAAGEGEKPRSTAQADRPQEESKIDIPAACSYQGELTDVIFDELWKIAIRWEVGDNRVIVPKARSRIVAFGPGVLPKLDTKFADSNSLAALAAEGILKALFEKHPAEVQAFLAKNLATDDVTRRRNALTITGTLKIKDLGPGIVPFLDDEKLRGAAIAALGAVGSPAGNERLVKFLAPDQGDRLILAAASTLLKLKEPGIYPKLLTLLDHPYFTVREGIAAQIGANREQLQPFVEKDLAGGALTRSERLGLLRAAGAFAELKPSKPLYTGVSRSLASPDPVERAFAVRALSQWLAFKGPEWKSTREAIRKRFDALKKTEKDSTVAFLLDRRP